MSEWDDLVKNKKLYALNTWMFACNSPNLISQPFAVRLEALINELNEIDTMYSNFFQCVTDSSPEFYMPLFRRNIASIVPQCSNLLENNSCSYDSWYVHADGKQNSMLWIPEYWLGQNPELFNTITYQYPTDVLLWGAIRGPLPADSPPADRKKGVYPAGSCTTALARYRCCDQYLWNLLAIPITQDQSDTFNRYTEAQLTTMSEACTVAIKGKYSQKAVPLAKFGILVTENGVLKKGTNKSKEQVDVTISDWAQKGLFPIAPLILYERFAFMGKRRNQVHKLEKQYYITSGCDKLDSPYLMDNLIESDALYHEMCTGVSLTAEITAFLLSIQKSFEVIDSCLSKHQIELLWDQDIKDFWMFFLQLLKDHSSFLINCPLVFWRSGMIREVMDMVYQNFFYYPALHIPIDPDYKPPSTNYEDIRAYFRKALCLKATQINIGMLSPTRFAQQLNYLDETLLQQVEWDCQQVLDIEKSLADIFFSEVAPTELSDDLRTMLRYDAIAYQSGGYPPETTRAYQLLYKKISQHGPIVSSDIYANTYAEMKESFYQGYVPYRPTKELCRPDATMAHPQVIIPYHPDITWRIIKRRIKNKEKEWSNEDKRVPIQSSIDSSQMDYVPYYIKDELANIRKDYTDLLNAPALHRGNGIFRYCDTTHTNMQRIIAAAEAAKNEPPSQKCVVKDDKEKPYLRKRTIVHRIFEQVHETLYPDGYIDFSL